MNLFKKIFGKANKLNPTVRTFDKIMSLPPTPPVIVRLEEINKVRCFCIKCVHHAGTCGQFGCRLKVVTIGGGDGRCEDARTYDELIAEHQSMPDPIVAVQQETTEVERLKAAIRAFKEDKKK